MNKETGVEKVGFTSLSKAEQQEINDHLLKEFDQIVDIGDILVNDRGDCYIIEDLFWKDKQRWGDKEKGEDPKEKYPYKSLYATVRYKIHYSNKPEPEWTTSDYELSEKFRYNYVVFKGSIEELKNQAKEILFSDELDMLKAEDEKLSKDTGVMSLNKEAFIGLKKDIILKQNHLKSRMFYAKAMMESKVRGLREFADKMREHLKRINTVIWTIELYLGIKEDIYHIQQGIPATEEDPIHLMQEMLFMDEELGDPTNDGMDFRNIEDFDDWLCEESEYFKMKNYELIVPHKKCVRILRVRRDEKRYSENPFVNHIMNKPNFETYILIRNGENLYRILTDMQFGVRLFPSQTELMDLYTKLQEKVEKDTFYKEEDLEKEMESETDRYKRNIIIMQGLVDRTDVFGNVAGRVNFLSPESSKKGDVVFIHDADKSKNVEDGSLTFMAWLEKTRKEISYGSRVHLMLGKKYNDDNDWRFFKTSKKNYSYPQSLIYNVMKDKHQKKHYHYKEDFEDVMKIMYTPSDDVYGGWGDWGIYERKNRVSFRIEPSDCINYDRITHRHIDWLFAMMHDRRERRYYLKYMKHLIGLIKLKKMEMDYEKPFTDMLRSEITEDIPQDILLDYVHWWKTKNKHKRSLTSDDSKALRMIVKRINSDLKKGQLMDMSNLIFGDTTK